MPALPRSDSLYDKVLALPQNDVSVRKNNFLSETRKATQRYRKSSVRTKQEESADLRIKRAAYAGAEQIEGKGAQLRADPIYGLLIFY